MSKVERTSTRIKGFNEQEMDFQLMRSLAADSFGGGTAGEIFHARQEIVGDDAKAWPPAFTALARHCDHAGEEARAKGQKVSAREHFLRASMYWRAAEYFSDPGDPLMLERGLSSRLSFMSAIPFLKDKLSTVEIPFEGAKLPGYFASPEGAKGRHPTVLVLTGFDGTAEELYFQAACPGLSRGFNIMMVEGPGQVGAMRLNPELVFRPDFEKPISAMVDAALARKDVDPHRLALYGLSFGGYFAIRGAAHDRRVHALVSNSPIVDLRRYVLGFGGGEPASGAQDLALADIDTVPEELMSNSRKLLLKAACRRFGVKSYFGWLDRLKAFVATDSLSQISCPSLAMIGTGEGDEARAQYETFCTNVKGHVTRRVFERFEGADMHCQLGNLPLAGAVVFDWLTEVFS